MQRFFTRESYGTGDVHLWAGPLGIHLFWRDFWHSRIDWCWCWQEQEDVEPDIGEIIGKTFRAREIAKKVKPKHFAPAFAMMGLAGYVWPMIEAALQSSGMS